MLTILKFLPRKNLSRLIGFLMHLRGPWSAVSIPLFAWWYGIAVKDAEKPMGEYSSIGDFFVRRLRPEARPLASSDLVHPADSRILQSGPIAHGACIQAKGIHYRVQELLVDPDWKEKFEDGFFITYYLCPTDYHRVHSPVDGYIRRACLVPGDLWPVHEGAVATIPNLYCVNERLVVEIASDYGAVAVVFVGATNVGSIEVFFDSALKGNKGLPLVEKNYDPAKEIKKGQELGMFRMGSTVVVLYSKEVIKRHGHRFHLGPQVRVNSALLMG